MNDANGEIIFSDVQKTENERSVYVGAVDPSSGDAIFFDVRRENLKTMHSDLNLPEQGAYYLCDSNGNLLFYQAPFSVNEDSIEKYAANLCKQIRKGEIAETGDSVVDISGKKRGLYHNSISNGWICIMTIPYATVLSGFYRIMTVLCVAFVAFFVIMLVMSLRDWRLEKHIVHANASIHALCNTYYAIYRVNLKKATYVMMKGSDEMVKILPKTGNFEDMMQGFIQVVDEDTARELCHSFSLEHLRKLKKANVEDFGGDFLRSLDGEKKWVHVSFILDDALGEDEAMLAFRQIDAEKRK